MSTFVRLILVVMGLALLTACGSSMTRPDDSPALNLKGQQFKSVDVKVATEMREKFSGNSIFKETVLRENILRLLRVNKFVPNLGDETNGEYVLEVTVINGRIRSNFSAVFWGVMAGPDLLDGEVSVKKTTGEFVGRFRVNANYAFGGAAGGKEQVRMNWLYDAFAKQVVAGLLGDDKK